MSEIKLNVKYCLKIAVEYLLSGRCVNYHFSVTFSSLEKGVVVRFYLFFLFARFVISVEVLGYHCFRRSRLSFLCGWYTGIHQCSCDCRRGCRLSSCPIHHTSRPEDDPKQIKAQPQRWQDPDALWLNTRQQLADLTLTQFQLSGSADEFDWLPVMRRNSHEKCLFLVRISS